MSHYTTYVITKTNSKEELDKLMLPYHEYECTGIKDYVVHVDRTAEAIKEYASHKDDYESIEEFLESWYGIDGDNIFEEEPKEKPADEYAVVKDGQIVKCYDYTNPNHKWDYYTPYTWEQCPFLKDGANGEVKAIEKSQLDINGFMSNLREAAPFWAIVLPTGQWIEHGHMGWWAISWDEDKDFNKTWTEIWKTIPDDCYVWRCDCHT